MALVPPHFVQGEGIDAVAEYRRFLDDVGEAASHLLAELADLQHRGRLEDIPEADDLATAVRGLYCRRVAGWAVFYAAQWAWNRCRIRVVLVAPLNPHPFGALESEAEARLRDLSD